MIDIQDIKQFLNNPTLIKEKAYLECKLAANSLPKDFWKSFSAFSNTQGGFILLGVSENDGEFKITGVKDIQKVVDDLYSQARGGQKVSHHTLNDESVFYHNDIFAEKNVIAVYVPKAENNYIPVHLNGDITNAYIRLNTGDHKLSSAELKNLLSGYTKINQDSRIIPNTSLNEIYLPTLNKFRQYVKNHNSTSPLLSLDDLTFLKRINAYQVDLHTKTEGLTYAGLLMFGQLHIIRSLLPHYFLEYKSKESEQRYDERITCDDLEEGNLFEFYLSVAPKLFKLAKNKHFALNHLTRTEDNLITDALREALINTLTHSDYFNDSVTVKISQILNTLTFENPGAMLVSIEQAKNGQKSECRNAILHNMFRRIGLCEREGKGIETIFANYRKELLTSPTLYTNAEKTNLILTLQDSAVIQANLSLEKYLGKTYQTLDNDLHKKILLLAALNQGWINHAILSENLEVDHHSRDITVALPSLERKGLLIGQGKQKEKFYILPWVKDKDIKDVYGKCYDVMVNQNTSISAADSFQQANLQANLQASLQACEESASDTQQILTYYHFSLDEYGRTVKGDRKIITHLTALEPNYLQSLQMKIPSEFYHSKRKSKAKVRELVAALCRDQFMTKKALATLLGMTESSLRLHLKEFVEQGMLELAFPQQPTHQDQSYHLKQRE